LSQGRIRGPRGQGTVAKEGDRWVLRRSIVVDGERTRVRTYHTTKAEALSAQRHAAPLTAAAAVTVGEWLARWEVNMRDDLLPFGREARFTEISQHRRTWLTPLFGDVRLTELTPSMCNDGWRVILAAGRTRKTVQNVRSTLVQALTAAMADDVLQLQRNAAHLSTIAAAHRAASGSDSIREQVLDLPQFRTLTAWCIKNETSRWATATLVAADTGLRRGEVLGLAWSDIDWKANRLTVQRQVVNTREYGARDQKASVPKTAESRRTIPVHKRTLDALQRHRESTEPSELRVIFHKAGEMEKPNVWTDWARDHLGPAIGLTKFHLHQLRHTHASQLLSAGTPIAEVSRRLGHSNLATTLKTYGHAMPTDAGRAILDWERDVLGTDTDGTVDLTVFPV
jgi:integrase